MQRDLHTRAEWHANRGYLIVPVKSGDKSPPADGFTGEKSPDRTFDEWAAFVEKNPGYGNLALRMPKGIVGVDVDGYKAEGADTYAKIKHAMPQTAVISARFYQPEIDPPEYVYDGISGIYLYRSTLDRGGLPGIDVIRWGHRYAMAPGSTHPSGRIYGALDYRTGEMDLPDIRDLPPMPPQLADLLRTVAPPKYEGPTGEINRDVPCNYYEQMYKQFEAIDWTSPGQRHNEMLRITRAVTRGQGDGHRGAWTILKRMVDLWDQRNPGRHTEITHAIGNVFPVIGQDDPCDGYHDVLGLTPDTPGITWVGPVPPGFKAAETEDTDSVDGLWESRDWLAWCQFTARRLGHRPWAFVGAALGWATATIAPEVTVNLGKGRISLNQFIMLVGGPSSGKSLAFQTVEEAFEWGLLPTGVGTGEGVARMFVHRVNEKDEITGQKINRVVQHSFRGLLWEDEWARLTTVQASRGGTIDAVLRSAWMGGHLGQANRSDETTLPVRKHAYRLAVVAGSQIEPAMHILSNEASGLGTSQRWLFFQAKKDIEQPDLEVMSFPSQIPQRFTRDSSMIPVEMLGTPEVRLAFRDYQAEEVDSPGREHQALRTIKIAAVVALMEGREEVEITDWNLALRIDAHSTRMKNRLIEDAAALRRTARVEATASKLIVEAEAQEKVADVQLVKQAMRVQAKVAEVGTGVTKKDLKKMWDSAGVRKWRDAAIDYCLSQGWIVEVAQPQANGAPGVAYLPPPHQPRG